MSVDLLAPLKDVRERISRAAERSGRHASDISLVAVTKTVPLDRVRPLLEAGVTHLGENRVQEALEKYSALSPRPSLHLIGQLQSNKAKKAVGFFDVIQSVDRIDLARDIDRHAAALGKKQQCLIEIKISAEESKSGLAPENLPEFMDQANTLAHVEFLGLMGIAPYDDDPKSARPYFQRLKKLFDQASSDVRRPTSDLGRRTAFDVLSMGMSGDFEVAIEEGSTMVRLGTLLFGSR